MNVKALGSFSSEHHPTTMEQLMKAPALKPPSGVKLDFANPGGKHILGYSIIIICSALSSIAVILRLYARYLLKRFRIQDALFITSLGLYSGHQYAIYSLSISPGLHVHQWNVPMRTYIRVQHDIHVAFVLYGLVVMCLKASILLDWVEIFVPVKQRNYIFWVSHIIIWCNVMFYSVGTIVGIFQCIPHERIWNPLIEGSCPINMTAHNKMSGALNLVSDLLILALPQRMIWKLQMTINKKAGLSLLFAIGVFACVCVVVRFVQTVRLLNSDEWLYIIGDLGLWTNAEMTAGFLILGIPALPKIIQEVSMWESISSVTKDLPYKFGLRRIAKDSTSNTELVAITDLWGSLDAEERVRCRTESAVDIAYGVSSTSIV